MICVLRRIIFFCIKSGIKLPGEIAIIQISALRLIILRISPCNLYWSVTAEDPLLHSEGGYGEPLGNTKIAQLAGFLWGGLILSAARLIQIGLILSEDFFMADVRKDYASATPCLSRYCRNSK